MHATLIVNPISGRGRAAKAAAELRHGLEARGISVDLHETHARGDARALAARLNGKSSFVVGVGGDGTLNEIVNGLPDRALPVAFFPAGTSNVLALDLDLPRRVPEAVEAFVGGRTRAIDLARVNGRLAFLFAGVGFDAMVLERLERRRQGAITKWTYVPAIARALAGYRGPELRVVVDGEPIEGVSMAIVSNVACYGGPFFLLDPTRRVDDGLLECYLFRGRSRTALVRHGLAAMARRLKPGPSLVIRRARRVRIESDAPVPYQVDGDLAGTTPIEIEILSGALRLVVPA